MTVIRACPLCGSRNLKSPISGSLVIPGHINYAMFACLDCINRVIPIEFDNEENYKTFLKFLKEDKRKF